MTIGAWRERRRPPAASEIPLGLASTAQPRWSAITGWLRDTYGLAGDIAWGGTDDGWVLRFRRSGRSLVTLSPKAGDGFVALVVVGPTIWGAVEELALSASTLAAFRSAVPYADGRWLWLDVADDATVHDVQALVARKSPPPRRAIVAGGAGAIR